MKHVVICACFVALALSAQDKPPETAGGDPWNSISFLQGTWEAKTQGGSAGADAGGSYTFQPELNNHILARHSRVGDCAGPATYDCEHHDLLYIFQESPGALLKAVYFDNEGHVIHYDVSTPNATTAVFTSESAPSGLQFRLIYELRNAIMSGKFQMRMPEQADWKSYLEWSGRKKR